MFCGIEVNFVDLNFATLSKIPSNPGDVNTYKQILNPNINIPLIKLQESFFVANSFKSDACSYKIWGYL